MGEILALSHSATRLPHSRAQAWCQSHYSLDHYELPSSLRVRAKSPTLFPRCYTRKNGFMWGLSSGSASNFKVPTTFAAGGAGGGPSGGHGGNNGGGGREEGSEDGKEEPNERKPGLTMAQKLTLGFAFLVGAGGAVGYLKSGSTKSLIAGGVSASLLYCVFTMLPTNPVLASSVGFAISAGLLGVMGPRFMASKKVFPAGIVSLVSLVMTGGYLHGIFRSLH
ncbi:unnamed protein product [Cuscuta campestris]|uniref:Uncharacterized protein n=1 Tax=Cuscuta campestris TaxID=132261 RepID=A0A484KMT4_9ASTE|nr:unnamed protein product [Cuscuta campestris]